MMKQQKKQDINHIKVEDELEIYLSEESERHSNNHGNNNTSENKID